ncbi:hypothetical protein [Stutzerimonas xanthomarina]|uniref:hypothetical protein n=1 Tax=Stutzerimonas xanthomarina TaxID=271420 RepID=UPI003AA7CE77
MSTVKKLMMAGGIEWAGLAIGTPVEGGYYAGIMRYSDGDYALIVAPKAAETSLQTKTTYSSTSGTQSYHDGLANSNAMNNPTHPAAQYCRAYAGDGYLDWYLPARDELELLYRNLKPGTVSNLTGARPESGSHGQNANSVPVGAAYTVGSPTQTAAAAFREGATEALAGGRYSASTEYAPDPNNSSWSQEFGNGRQRESIKTVAYLVRPVRRVKI